MAARRGVTNVIMRHDGDLACCERSLRFRYSKDESEDLDYQQFDVLVTERESVPGFKLWHVEYGFDHLDLSVEDNSIGIRTRPMIFVHEKN